MRATGVDQTRYLVTVTRQGSPVGTHIVEAVDALKAINLVERYYRAPDRQERISGEDEVDPQYEIAETDNWHGFMFQAQAIGPAANSPADLQSARDMIKEL